MDLSQIRVGSKISTVNVDNFFSSLFKIHPLVHKLFYRRHRGIYMAGDSVLHSPDSLSVALKTPSSHESLSHAERDSNYRDKEGGEAIKPNRFSLFKRGRCVCALVHVCVCVLWLHMGSVCLYKLGSLTLHTDFCLSSVAPSSCVRFILVITKTLSTQETLFYP